MCRKTGIKASPEIISLATIISMVESADLPSLNKTLRELLSAALSSEVAEYWDKETRSNIGFYLQIIPETYEQLINFSQLHKELHHG